MSSMTAGTASQAGMSDESHNSSLRVGILDTAADRGFVVTGAFVATRELRDGAAAGLVVAVLPGATFAAGLFAADDTARLPVAAGNCPRIGGNTTARMASTASDPRDATAAAAAGSLWYWLRAFRIRALARNSNFEDSS